MGGVGKSTLLNGLTGTKNFASGISVGGGLTDKLQMFEFEGDVYMDTPGLSDIELRKQAAAAINKAMSMGGRFKLFFVITLDAGRVRPVDLTTMKLVLGACSDIPAHNGYGIIINKLHKKVMKKLQTK